MIVHRGAARSWVWIDDLARGFADVIEKGEAGIYNVGRDDDEISMTNLAFKIIDAVNRRPRRVDELMPEGHEIVKTINPPALQTPVKRISTAKLRALGWKPTVDLDEGLPKMVEWIRGWLESEAKK
jgi:nucleoside-diphosphate-sugar epimerase